jgi:YggT family protein
VLAQIGAFLVDTLATFFVFLLLARFHFQWLRAPFRNPAGEFVLATTSWLVMPARRVVPGLAGLDLASLLLAWVIQMVALWAQIALAGGAANLLAVAAVAAVDLVRFSVYILIFAVIVQAVLSWVNPYTPLGPVFGALTRPFLRPFRRFIPPIGNVDLTPLVLLVLLQVLLFPVGYLRAAAATLG